MDPFQSAGATRKPLVVIFAGGMIAVATFAGRGIVAASATHIQAPPSRRVSVRLTRVGPLRSSGRPAASLGAATAAGTRSEIAAVVDGRPIPVSRVRDVAVRLAGAGVLDQLIGNILIDQEARRRHVVVPPSEVDMRIDHIRDLMKPATLEESLRTRHMSLEEMRDQIRVQIEFEKLIGPTLSPRPMSHIASIFVSAQPSVAVSEPGRQTHTIAQATAIIDDLRKQLRAGASFGELARKFSDDLATKEAGGDLGIITDVPGAAVSPSANALCADPGFREAALKLKRGEVGVVPMTGGGGFHVITALSTAADHDSSENALYRAAELAAREGQFGLAAPAYIQSLRANARVAVYLGTEVAGPAGVAATVNGRSIPLSQVEDIAYRTAGPSILRHMIDEVLVDQEARRKGIVVTRAEVDAKIRNQRKSMGAVAFENMLRRRNMSLAEYRDEAQIELASYHLVWKSLGPIKLVHVRHILFLTNADVASHFRGAKPHSDSEARALIARMQAELRAGKKFEDLARKYSDDAVSKVRGGDLGVIGPETRFGGTIYQAACALKCGEITEQLVSSPYGLHLIMAVSTEASHSPVENALYARAVDDVHMQELQVFLRPYLQHLRATSKIVDNFAGQDPAPQSTS